MAVIARNLAHYWDAGKRATALQPLCDTLGQVGTLLEEQVGAWRAVAAVAVLEEESGSHAQCPRPRDVRLGEVADVERLVRAHPKRRQRAAKGLVTRSK